MLKTASLTPLQKDVLLNKATEYPFTGDFTDVETEGSYLCRQCGSALFRSSNKFHSGCGWASFDDEIAGAVSHLPDHDGRRTGIVCAKCNGHLGHVFHGEGFTPSNARYCVNSASLDFVTDSEIINSEEIILAAGCFWGVEYYLQKVAGVVLTQVGYCGGNVINPCYEEVKQQTTGHLEVVRVIWDSDKQNLATILKAFFETHDPEQTGGQGPDIGNQYLSAIFYYNDKQQQTAKQIMQILTDKGYQLATQLRPMETFWLAEEYHRDYYNRKGSLPYCHGYVKRF
ncbi:MAG: bifunctional methionine sulfoxide reductase B/A protein [Proteobacteria bacterium]|nr:MAG: bifunctional methionine sulfoxide reductase B/A protein [Pseudomonadota bacterium]